MQLLEEKINVQKKNKKSLIGQQYNLTILKFNFASEINYLQNAKQKMQAFNLPTKLNYNTDFSDLKIFLSDFQIEYDKFNQSFVSLQKEIQVNKKIESSVMSIA